MNIISALGAGLAGATALTVLHEVNRRIDPRAPRMDLLGMNALELIFKKAGKSVPSSNTLHKQALAADIISNLAYYSLAGIGNKNLWTKSSLLGLGAGIGALLLPKPMGLNPEHSNKSARTQFSTVALYLVGGLVTGAVLNLIRSKQQS